MRLQTEGIILRYFKYGDNGVIAHIYTEKYGQLSFLFKSAKSRTSKHKMNFLQPLSLVQVPIEYKPSKDFYLGNGTQPLFIFQSIPFQQIKSSNAFFIAELLSKLLQNHDADTPLFAFLKESVLFLDAETTKGTNFHLTFLIKLMQHFGVQPDSSDTTCPFLDVEQGFYVNSPNTTTLSQEQSKLWTTLQQECWEHTDKLPLSREQRNHFLEKTMQYYAFHLHDIGKLKSLEVLRELFLKLN